MIKSFQPRTSLEGNPTRNWICIFLGEQIFPQLIIRLHQYQAFLSCIFYPDKAEKKPFVYAVAIFRWSSMWKIDGWKKLLWIFMLNVIRRLRHSVYQWMGKVFWFLLMSLNFCDRQESGIAMSSGSLLTPFFAHSQTSSSFIRFGWIYCS